MRNNRLSKPQPLKWMRVVESNYSKDAYETSQFNRTVTRYYIVYKELLKIVLGVFY